MEGKNLHFLSNERKNRFPAEIRYQRETKSIDQTVEAFEECNVFSVLIFYLKKRRSGSLDETKNGHWNRSPRRVFS